MLAHLRRLASRFLLMLGGEVVQSAFHFAFNILLMRLLPVRDYGIFAIVLLIGGLALTYMRALCGVPASLTVPINRGRRAAAAYEVSFGSAALFLTAMITGAVALGLRLWFGLGAGLAGAFVGLWALRSYTRVILFARGQPLLAGACDVIFAGSGLVLSLGLLHGRDEVLLDRAFLVLCLANGLAIAAALVLPRRPVRIGFGRPFRRRYRALARQLAWSCLGVTTANVQAQGQVLLIALIAGPEAYAPIAAMVVFFAPLRLASSALANMMQPELAGLAVRGEWRSIRHLLVMWTVGLFFVAAATGVALALVLPWVHLPVFAGHPELLIGALAWSIAAAAVLYVMPRILLEVFRAFRLITVITAASAAAGMVIAGLLLLVADPAWSLVGPLTSEIAVAVWCWLAVERETTKIRRLPARVEDAGGHASRYAAL